MFYLPIFTIVVATCWTVFRRNLSFSGSFELAGHFDNLGRVALQLTVFGIASIIELEI
jgi:hypothetical protein